MIQASLLISILTLAINHGQLIVWNFNYNWITNFYEGYFTCKSLFNGSLVEHFWLPIYILIWNVYFTLTTKLREWLVYRQKVPILVVFLSFSLIYIYCRCVRSVRTQDAWLRPKYTFIFSIRTKYKFVNGRKDGWRGEITKLFYFFKSSNKKKLICEKQTVKYANWGSQPFAFLRAIFFLNTWKTIRIEERTIMTSFFLNWYNIQNRLMLDYSINIL